MIWQSNLTLHLSTHAKGPPWPCPECFRSFSRLASLKAHTMIHELEENLFCEQCGEECISQRAASLRLTQHRKPHRSRRTAHTHACKVCDLAFNKPSQLIRHLRIHTGEKPYGVSFDNVLVILRNFKSFP
ncbi:hypothetical protein B566_EDAN009644 [Ephemera danica]|nr:hypothetical protein B566_EDAN009644 [Ephemera danica]